MKYLRSKGAKEDPLRTCSFAALRETKNFETVKEMCPDSKVLEGFEMKGGVERDGVYLVIKDVKRREAETNVKAWLYKVRISTK